MRTALSSYALVGIEAVLFDVVVDRDRVSVIEPETGRVFHQETATTSDKSWTGLAGLTRTRLSTAGLDCAISKHSITSICINITCLALWDGWRDWAI